MRPAVRSGVPWALALAWLAAAAPAGAQRNGEATMTTPAVERERYDTTAFMAPLRLTEAEAAGRRLVAQRCANCHGGNTRQPGPPLGRQLAEARGDAAIRERIRTGSALMPGFGYTLTAAQIDQIIAFLKTYSAPARAAGAGQE